MRVGCCSLKFYLHGNRSLKGKRRVVKTIKDRTRNKFNVSIAEIGDQEVWQNLHLGVAAISTDQRYLEGLMNQVINFIDNLHLGEMTDSEVKIIQVGKII